MRDESPEAVARRAADAERKRTERARKKQQLQEAAQQAKANGATSYRDYWQLERAKLTEAERAAFEEREMDVWSVRELMALYLDGKPAELELPDVIELVQEEIAEHKPVAEIVLVVRFWSDDERDFRERAVKAFGKPTEIFMQYGYLTALDTSIVHRFFTKFAKSEPTTSVPRGNGYTILQCAACTSITGQVAAQDSIAAEYREKGIPFGVVMFVARLVNCYSIQKSILGQVTEEKVSFHFVPAIRPFDVVRDVTANDFVNFSDVHSRSTSAATDKVTTLHITSGLKWLGELKHREQRLKAGGPRRI